MSVNTNSEKETNDDFEKFKSFLDTKKEKLPLFYQYLMSVTKEDSYGVVVNDRTFEIPNYQNTGFIKRNEHYRPILKNKND